MEQIKFKLLDGTRCVGNTFDFDDYKELLGIYRDWLNLNRCLKSLGGRNLNVPDVFGESLFCYFFNAIRTNGSAYSYDCVMKDTLAGVQIKSCSIKNDCSSFGPTSTWDEFYFIDFAKNGTIDGKAYIYKIDIDFSNIVLNEKKGETFHDQQMQGRRPRFSIKQKIIKPYHLKPIKIINLEADIVKYLN